MRLKGNFLSEPHKTGLECGVRGVGAARVSRRAITLTPPLHRCQAVWPWDTAAPPPPPTPSVTFLSSQATPRRLWDSWLWALQGNQDFGLRSSYVTHLPQEVIHHWG